jgi:hypothetical protein
MAHIACDPIEVENPILRDRSAIEHTALADRRFLLACIRTSFRAFVLIRAQESTEVRRP